MAISLLYTRRTYALIVFYRMPDFPASIVPLAYGTWSDLSKGLNFCAILPKDLVTTCQQTLRLLVPSQITLDRTGKLSLIWPPTDGTANHHNAAGIAMDGSRPRDLAPDLHVSIPHGPVRR